MWGFSFYGVFIGMEGYYGQIILFPNNYVPRNWMLCDGSKIHIKDNMALHAVLGEGFRVDDEYFVLPQLYSPHSELDYIICVDGLFPQRR